MTSTETRYDCPSYSGQEGYPIPCQQLMPGSLEDQPEYSKDDRIALCDATLKVASETDLASMAACGFQKFLNEPQDMQIRIKTIAGGAN